jgi:hypothetical protein
MRYTCKISIRKPEGKKDHLRGIGINGRNWRIILKWILNYVLRIRSGGRPL